MSSTTTPSAAQSKPAPKQRDEDRPQTAAEELLAQAYAPSAEDQRVDALEERAKREAKARDEALNATPTAEQKAAAETDPITGHDSDHNHGHRPDQLIGGHVFYGHFAVVTEGEHKGKFGVYEDTISVGDDGLPELVRFRTRDARNEVIAVAYKSLAATDNRGNAPR